MARVTLRNLRMRNARTQQQGTYVITVGQMTGTSFGYSVAGKGTFGAAAGSISQTTYFGITLLDIYTAPTPTFTLLMDGNIPQSRVTGISVEHSGGTFIGGAADAYSYNGGADFSLWRWNTSTQLWLSGDVGLDYTMIINP